MGTAWTQTFAWMLIFFFASAAASSAYLTASEVFPLETRALAIATFYAVGTAIGGTIAPALFGHLIETSSGACRRVHIRRLADACCCRCGGRIRHRRGNAFARTHRRSALERIACSDEQRNASNERFAPIRQLNGRSVRWVAIARSCARRPRPAAASRARPPR